ncbi:hypothetical protein AbraIFM66951_006733 [Aspergillus brasiliensis]|uniref:Heterokaryon incompatibility domain-containing protein n=1 Tax=Aspergillus brasiliensis TaxID=319629 RepID=A0A9W5YSQ7_9EURO|nr:hypothetical protein AbraCBS73388_007447 [Aspergillus brasiliensis]GKZ44529.1 hypothetical protein AbraIFM66951_006733 [Aspergillus brasiliensis]
MSAKRIHWPTVSLWLGNCDFGTMDHTVSCHKDTPPSILSQFRVIDTENQCVVLAPPFCKYAALSYVWGDTKGSTQALVSNIASLEKRGSLSETKVSLSAVIRDAMTVCRHLGVGYLWVDQLCILQDEDMAKKALHLNAMGEIYGNSYVTLVDLVGTNANHGLSGVGARQRVSRRSGRTQGLYLLGGCEPYDRILRRSKWMTRGWTFQESTLSPRLLLFSETMLTYECSGRNFVTDDERGNVAFSSKVKIPLGSYQDIVRLYTKRTLSFEPDILRAFAGILHAACGSDHYFGLPLGRFTQSLSWYTDNGKYYPRRETREGTEIFPSWSWSSTTSSIRFDMEDLRTITVPMALSAIPAPENKTQPFKVISDTSALGRAEVPPIAYPFYLSSALVLIQAWREGCFAETIPMELDNAELTWKQYLTIIRDKQSSLAKLCNAARGIDPQTFMVRDFHSKFPAHLQCKCEPGCVMVYTQSLRLRIVPATEGYGEPNLQDQQGRIIAWLLPHTANWNSITNTLTNGRTSQLDVIALSFETYPVGFEHHETYKSWQGYSGQEDLTWYDSSGKALRFAEKPRIQLMVVKTKNGISKRVALAETWLRVWIYAKPQFQTFILA